MRLFFIFLNDSVVYRQPIIHKAVSEVPHSRKHRRQQYRHNG